MPWVAVATGCHILAYVHLHALYVTLFLLGRTAPTSQPACLPSPSDNHVSTPVLGPALYSSISGHLSVAQATGTCTQLHCRTSLLQHLGHQAAVAARHRAAVCPELLHHRLSQLPKYCLWLSGGSLVGPGT